MVGVYRNVTVVTSCFLLNHSNHFSLRVAINLGNVIHVIGITFFTQGLSSPCTYLPRNSSGISLFPCRIPTLCSIQSIHDIDPSSFWVLHYLRDPCVAFFLILAVKIHEIVYAVLYRVLYLFCCDSRFFPRVRCQ